MALPPGHIKRKTVDKILDKVASVIKGFLARSRFKRIRFLNVVTGQKYHQMLEEDL
jgi:hypothetical protein